MSPEVALDRRLIVRFLLNRSFFFMLALIVVESALAAATTWLVIQAGRDIVDHQFKLVDFAWIVATQSASYVVGAVSWVFAERAGFAAYGRYMLEFARINRHRSTMLGDAATREQVEPFLTNEGFQVYFDLMYELETDLKLLFGLVFNAVVLGVAIDVDLPLAFLATFLIVLFLQWLLRQRIAQAYLRNQERTNAMTAQSYGAWDNVLGGNRYNFRLWSARFKSRLREALAAQIRAIVAREGMATVSGIIGLVLVFAAMAAIVLREGADAALLVGLAATLPRQIDMAHDVHVLASAWNDLLALWTRLGGMAANLRPQPRPVAERIAFDQLILQADGAEFACGSVREALGLVGAARTGRVRIRGDNGTGKSTLLAELKAALKGRAHYVPAADSMTWHFVQTAGAADGFSSGQRQRELLEEILRETRSAVYLLDEWDANLDAANRAECNALIERLAMRARCVEVTHRAQTAQSGGPRHA